jgi:hypothetical protein
VASNSGQLVCQTLNLKILWIGKLNDLENVQGAWSEEPAFFIVFKQLHRLLKAR